MMIHKINV